MCKFLCACGKFYEMFSRNFNFLLFSIPTFPFSHQYFQTRSSSESCQNKTENIKTHPYFDILPIFLMFYRFIVTSYQNSLVFRHATSRHFWSGCLSLHLASRISRHIDNLSVCTICQLFHSTLLESDREARGRSLFEKNNLGNNGLVRCWRGAKD